MFCLLDSIDRRACVALHQSVPSVAIEAREDLTGGSCLPISREAGIGRKAKQNEMVIFCSYEMKQKKQSECVRLRLSLYGAEGLSTGDGGL